MDPINIPDELLRDARTGKNIIFNTSEYKGLGDGFQPGDEVKADINGHKIADWLRPYFARPKDAQKKAKKKYAEVVTPPWLVCYMLNQYERETFGQEIMFSCDPESKTYGRIPMVNILSRYIDLTGCEIACGEAPFITTRYDLKTGDRIELGRRCGILDRKLALVRMWVYAEDAIPYFAFKCLRSTYGYELRGDALAIARWNVYQTFEATFIASLGRILRPEERAEAIDIIAKNIYQYDGRQYGLRDFKKTRGKTQVQDYHEYVQLPTLDEDGMPEPLNPPLP